jgi:hypothetical protein
MRIQMHGQARREQDLVDLLEQTLKRAECELRGQGILGELQALAAALRDPAAPKDRSPTEKHSRLRRGQHLGLVVEIQSDLGRGR